LLDPAFFSWRLVGGSLRHCGERNYAEKNGGADSLQHGAPGKGRGKGAYCKQIGGAVPTINGRH
jgi:hypothetical protein